MEDLNIQRSFTGVKSEAGVGRSLSRICTKKSDNFPIPDVPAYAARTVVVVNFYIIITYA